MFGYDAIELARFQFAFTVAFHIIFPAFTIGLASYLAVLNGLHMLDKAGCLSETVQLLEDDLRRQLRHGGRLRDHHVVSVRHQLVGLFRQGRADHRAADGLRSPFRPSSSKRAFSA